MTNTNDWRPLDFDGLVVESPSGERLLALPIAVLEVLRYASVIQYRRAGRVHRMRIDGFLDGRNGGHILTTAQDAIAADALEAQDPSPTPPPAPPEEQDPANIPLRVKRGGHWVDIHVTRAQYEDYERQGRITQEPPAETEGTDQ